MVTYSFFPQSLNLEKILFCVTDPDNSCWKLRQFHHTLGTCITRSWVQFSLTGVQPLSDHYGDVIMDAIASQITSLTVVYSTVYSDADQMASPAFVWGIHRGQVNSPHKWPVTRKMFPFDDVIMLRFCLVQGCIPNIPNGLQHQAKRFVAYTLHL